MWPKILRLGLHLFNIACISGFYIFNLNRTYPWVGGDFAHFVPRLIDTYLHIRLNGWGIQWYSPSFGAGLPAFAGAQHPQYTLQQFFTLFTDPWIAILLTVTAMSALGYFGMYQLARQVMGLGWQAATLGGIFFTLNGFYLSHLLVGHVSFIGFPLLPLILWRLLERDHPVWVNAILISLVGAVLIYSGGVYISVIFVFSTAISLPILYLIQAQSISWRRLVPTLAIGALLSLALTGNKLFAVLSYMHFFPREVYAGYPAPFLQKITGMIFQLVGSTMIVPLRLLQGRDPNAIPEYLVARSGIDLMYWELDTAVSGLLFVIVVLGLAWQVLQVTKNPRLLSFAKIIALIALFGSLAALAQYAVAEGPVYTLAKTLPFIGSLHVNPRNTAALILPLALIGAYTTQKVFSLEKWHAAGWVLLNLFSILALAPYLMLDPQLHPRFIEVKPLREIYWQIRAGETFPVRVIAEDQDIEVFDRHSSSLIITEPAMGYDQKAFHPLVVPGSIYLQDGEYLNMTNPASLVYPQENGLTLFERFKVTERDKLEQFANRRQPDFKLPPSQHFLNILSVVTLIIELTVLSGVTLMRLSRRANPAR